MPATVTEIESGLGSGTAVGAGTTVYFVGSASNTLLVPDNTRLIAYVASDEVFTLDVRIPNGIGTQETANHIVKSTNAGINSDPTYDYSAYMDVMAPPRLAVAARNTSGSTANYIYDIRLHQNS